MKVVHGNPLVLYKLKNKQTGVVVEVADFFDITRIGNNMLIQMILQHYFIEKLTKS